MPVPSSPYTSGRPQIWLALPAFLALMLISGCRGDYPVLPVEKGAIIGKVTDLYSGQPIAGAFIRTTPASQSVTTDNNGNYTIDDVPTAEYEVRAEKVGYTTRSVRVIVTNEVTVTADIALDASGDTTEQHQGSALKFTGAGYRGNDTYIEVPSSSDLHLSNGSFTIEAWVRPSTFDTWNHIVSKGHTNNDADYTFGTNYGRIEVVSRNASNLVYGNTSMSPDTWYHIVGVQDAAQGKIFIYLNGVLDGSASLYGTGISTTASLLIGARDGQATGTVSAEGFNGYVHEVRIWNKARSQSEIASTMRQRLTGTEPGLVAYWKLNEGTGQTVTDATGKGHGGVLRNNPRWYTTALPLP